jgi:flagellar hook protein FlgE
MTSFSSIYGTGISGLNAFGTQLQNISGNIANIQTIGFKVTDTGFNDNNVAQNTLLNKQGIVQARNINRNGMQGALSAGDSISDLAVNGPGYFSVQTPYVTIDAAGNSTPTFTGASQQFTRKGDFNKDVNGYLVNSDGNYLLGVALPGTTNGVLATADLTPVKITAQGTTSPAVATSNVTGILNFPANAADGATYNQTLTVYDSTGAAQTVPVVWTKMAGGGNNWTVAAGTLPGTIASITPTNGTLAFNSDGTLAPTSGGAAANGAVGISFTIQYANGSAATSPQTVSLNLGSAASGTDPTAAGYIAGTGTTQFYAGRNELQSNALVADGHAEGLYNGFTLDNDGVVSATYTNGVSTPLYRVPLTTFPNPQGLARISGTLFGQIDTASGVGLRNWSGAGGAGSLLTRTLEQSTVDTAKEFTNMIQAQRAYSANSKSVTTADEMITTLIGIAR